MSDNIYFPKWVELLVTLYNTPENKRYCGFLHRKTGITIRHLRTLVSELEDFNFVVVAKKRNNKIKYIDLTETGKRVALSLLKIFPVFKR